MLVCLSKDGRHENHQNREIQHGIIYCLACICFISDPQDAWAYGRKHEIEDFI